MIAVLSEFPARRRKHTVSGQWISVLAEGSPEHGGQGEAPLTQPGSQQARFPNAFPPNLAPFEVTWK